MIIGITGGIASGKTVVSCYLEEKGYPIIDADVLSREVIAEKATVDEIVAAFGEAVLEEGRLSREKLGQYIFSDEAAREQLNAIMHPAIYARTKERLAEYGADDVVFLVVPLLYETGFDALCDDVWLVVTAPQLKAQRLMARDAIDKGYAQQKIASQIDDGVRLSHQPKVLTNNDTLEKLYEQVEKLLCAVQKNQ